jgi:hypothetical protein
MAVGTIALEMATNHRSQSLAENAVDAPDQTPTPPIASDTSVAKASSASGPGRRAAAARPGVELGGELVSSIVLGSA